ncbi:uncharacterized protein UTRI_01813 [Ustilago trichophora]|uniref:Uncharacterized protein n=1 Tax=Ustilago trichophora TaxID=86804 RepID=A0A5C3DY38_9BASI|nr:uncharacterized protein UTRI_01813 [Ustilago trichophora]
MTDWRTSMQATQAELRTDRRTGKRQRADDRRISTKSGEPQIQPNPEATSETGPVKPSGELRCATQRVCSAESVSNSPQATQRFHRHSCLGALSPSFPHRDSSISWHHVPQSWP